MAALTLYARTLRHDDRRGVYAGLGYHDVWLDKDAVVAPDGTLYFADLEGIEEVAAGDPGRVREEIARRFHRNVYEAFYAMEALAVAVERQWRLPRGPVARRRWILDALGRACATDPYLALEPRGGKLLLHVEPIVDPDACHAEIGVADEDGS